MIMLPGEKVVIQTRPDRPSRHTTWRCWIGPPTQGPLGIDKSLAEVHGETADECRANAQTIVDALAAARKEVAP